LSKQDDKDFKEVTIDEMELKNFVIIENTSKKVLYG
jgi:hypothetical protein